MPVDASIPLQATGPAPITLNSISQMMQLKQQITQQKQAQAVQNSLAAIYGNPDNLGPDGLPKPDAIRQISSISPQMGIQLQTQKAKIDADKSLQQERTVNAYKAKAETIHNDLLDPSIVAYDSARESGMPEAQARAKAQQVYNDSREALQKSGMFSAEEIATMPTGFDPDRARAGAIKYKDYLGIQEKKKADDRADERQSNTERHEGVMESIAEARLGQSEKRSAEASEGGGANLTPDAVKAAAARYNLDGTLPPMGMGKAGAAARDQILNTAADLAKGSGVDPTQQRIDQLDSKASAAARTGLEKTINNVQLAEKTALGSAKQVEDISKGYDRTSSPLANKGINAYRSAIQGDPQLSKLSTAVNTLKNEYTKVMTGSGQSTDAARAEADHLININMGHDQLMASIGQMKAEMEQAREGAIQQSRDLSTKSTRDSGKGSSPGKTLTYDPATGTFK
jgi:hypothetical protein